MIVGLGLFAALLVFGALGGTYALSVAVARRHLEVTPLVPAFDLLYGPRLARVIVIVRRIASDPAILRIGLWYTLARALGRDPIAEASDEEIWLGARSAWRAFAGDTELFDQRKHCGECPASLERPLGARDDSTPRCQVRRPRRVGEDMS